MKHLEGNFNKTQVWSWGGEWEATRNNDSRVAGMNN